MSAAVAMAQTSVSDRHLSLPAPSVGLRQPAYAKRIHGLRAQRQSPQLGVWIVDGWQPFEDDGQFGEWILVIPDATPVKQLDFRCVAGLVVLIQAASTERVAEIAEQVDRFHPAQMFGYPEDPERLTYFQRRAA